jgi:single-strand DNA-binding protein
MSASINLVLIAGNFTKNPESKQVGNSTVTKFGIAINRRFKKADGTLGEDVTFVDCEAWDKQAEFVAKYMTKGRACFVEGRLQLDSWQTQDGQKRQKIKVVATRVHFMDSPKGDADAAPVAAVEAAPIAAPAPRLPVTGLTPDAGFEEPPF